MNNSENKITTSNQRIKELLSDLGVSQIEFCNKTGIKPSALSNYLNNNRVPRQDAISKIADAYNVSPTWIMGYDVPRDIELRSLIVKPNEGEYFEIYAPMAKYDLYSHLINEAEFCTDDQIISVIRVMEQFRQLNLKDD